MGILNLRLDKGFSKTIIEMHYVRHLTGHQPHRFEKIGILKNKKMEQTWQKASKVQKPNAIY